MKYNFSDHHIISFLKELSMLYPGIVDAFGFFTDTSSHLRLYKKDNCGLTEIHIKEDINAFIRFSKKSPGISWIRNDMLPNNQSKRTSKQLIIDDEQLNNWLFIKVTSPFSKNHDLVLLRIHQSGCFGINKDFSTYNTKEKSLISNLIHCQLKQYVSNSIKNRSINELINNSLQQLNNNLNQLKSEQKLLLDKQNNTYKQQIKYIIDSCTVDKKFEFKYDEEFIKEIISSNKDHAIIKQVIEKAIIIAINTSNSTNYNLTLLKEHLIWPIETKSGTTKTYLHKEKIIIDLLDRYENAAEKALHKGWKIIGNSLGNCCEPNVSAASITFNIKKYEKRISKMLNEHPNNWPILRNQFKPIINVLSRYLSSNQHLKSA